MSGADAGTGGGPLDPREVARLFRQRMELGQGPLFLDGPERVEAMRDAVRAMRRGRAAPAAPVQPGGSPPAAGATPRPGAGSAVSGKGAGPEAAGTPDVSDAVLATLDYEALRETALGCTRCGLSETRTRVVFSDGNPTARLVVVGEAPGANEDATGLPFVGAAGKLLDLMLLSVDLSREESVYICNVLKCRPPGNRNPQADEIACCKPYLQRQIELVEPEAILGVGTFAAQWLTGQDRPLGRLRGTVHAWQGVPVVVTYHPAALLRNSGWSRPAWDDLQLLRHVMDGT